MRSLVAGIGLALLSASVIADVSLKMAYWAPDRGTPYEWFEGAKEIQSFFAEDYRAAGYVKAYIHNDGDTPVSPSAFSLDGEPLDRLRDEYRAVWWRVLPDPIPAGGIGEGLVRLRDPLEEAATLRVEFGDAGAVSADIPPAPPRVRIETVGFTEAMDTVFIVAEALDGEPHRLRSVAVDGRDVTERAKLLDRAFTHGISPVSLRLAEPLQEGSYHVYSIEVDEGETVACCVRTYDGWVPLGTYGYSEFEEFARNGCNGHNNFGRHTKGQLDTHATLLMRGVNIVGDAGPAEHMVGHPGMWAYCLQDEPDCHDYTMKDVPAGKRVGYHAMEMEARCRTCREADPIKPTFLTLDMTYKPANWFIYGPIADITNVDCYTRAIGGDLRQAREVVETARRGAGPHPMTFTFESYFPDPDDPAELEERRFPRPPTAEELRLSVYWGLGAGARGFYSYIHCTERMGSSIFRGAVDYPDLWREIGRTYRTLDVVAPLIAQAHPTRLAEASSDSVWLRTLVCGEDALLLVCANEDYDEERMAFRYRPVEDVALRLPDVAWMTPRSAWRLTEGGLEALALEDGEMRLGRLDVAEAVLVSSDPGLGDRLWQRHVALERDRAEALLREWRRRQDAQAERAHAVRRLTGEFADRVVMGAGIGAYGAKPEGYWNPAGESHWAFEFGKNEAGEAPDMGAQWVITVGAAEAGKPHSAYVMCGAWGRPGELTWHSPDGTTLATEEVSAGTSGQIRRLRATPPEPGEYRLTLLVKGPGPKGGRAAHAIYVVPDALNPPEMP